MTFKWTERQPIAGNIVNADSVNESYDSYKGALNGNLGRDNLPHDVVDHRHLKPAAAYQTAVYDFSMADGDHVNTPTVLGPQGWTRDKFQAGWYEATSQTVSLKEGMLHIEVMGVCFYNNFDSTVVSGAQYGRVFAARFKVHVNGVEVLVSPDYSHIIQPVHIVADVPVAGGSTQVDVFWTISPLRGAYASDRCEFYFGSMQLFLMNRYR